MSAKPTTKISWTDATWNPVTGCSRVSPGCEHCYAEALSLRFKRSSFPWTANHAKDNVQLHYDRLLQPLSWRKPRRVFVNSMSDLFHELVPFAFVANIWQIMAETPQHTYQILTKRPERMQEFVQRWVRGEDDYTPAVPPNVWLGTSVEDQRRAVERIPILVATPAAVRFLSVEPLLAPMDLRRWLNVYGHTGPTPHTGSAGFLPIGPPSMLHWVIVGGESGPGYRPMDHAWARAIRDQCVAANVPFFFKQSAGPRTEMGKELDGQTWAQFPGQTGGQQGGGPA